jgi:hypothetical protein
VSGELGVVKSHPAEALIGELSFSHFIELIKVDIPLKRLFYETEAG